MSMQAKLKNIFALKNRERKDDLQEYDNGNGGTMDSSKPVVKSKPPINISKDMYLNWKDLDIDPVDQIGYGGAAILLKGKFKKEVVAIKKYHGASTRKTVQLLQEEANMLLELNHPNIVKCFGLCVEHLLLVLEIAGIEIEFDGINFVNQSLRDLLDNFQMSFRFYEIGLTALHQICQGLSYLHKNEICHNDLKSGNVLIFLKDDGYLFKLCDFGEATKELEATITATSSQSTSTKDINMKGTTPFISPERFLDVSIPFTTEQDIYALALIMYEMLNPHLSYPWEKECNKGQNIHEAIKSKVLLGERPEIDNPTVEEILSSKDGGLATAIMHQYISLMKECWDQDPNNRPNITKMMDLVSHFTVYQFEKNIFEDFNNEDRKVYDDIFRNDNMVSYLFIKEVVNWKPEKMKEIQLYLQSAVEDLRDTNKKGTIVNLGANVTSTISGIGGVVGFALLFSPFTIVPGIIVLGVAGGMGGLSGIASGGKSVVRSRQQKKTNIKLETLFQNAGVNSKAFDELVQCILECGQDLSNKYHFDIEKGLEYIQIFITKIWSVIRIINKQTIILQAFQNVLRQTAELETPNLESLFKQSEEVAHKTIRVLTATRSVLQSAEFGVSIKALQTFVQFADGTEGISSTGSAISAIKTFANIGKGAQALQIIGVAFSIVAIGAGVYGIVTDTGKIKAGYKDVLAEKLEMYEAIIENFMLLRQYASEGSDESLVNYFEKSVVL